jgi:hypothetical protein
MAKLCNAAVAGVKQVLTGPKNTEIDIAKFFRSVIRSPPQHLRRSSVFVCD